MKIKSVLWMSLLAILFVFNSCQVEKACETNSTGEITVRNSNSYPYTCSINGTTMGTVSANSSKTFTVSSGSKLIVVTQESGYILYPNVYQINTDISNCENYSYDF
jgi:hypothetical protein